MHILSERDQYLTMDDVQLLEHCRCDCYIGSGPGGQHRNRNYTGIRVVFKPLESITAADETERSQAANRRKALHKLRLSIARNCRERLPDTLEFSHFNEENQLYPLMLARLIDVIYFYKFDHKLAAEYLGLSNSKLLKELARDNDVWKFFQDERTKLGLMELKRPR